MGGVSYCRIVYVLFSVFLFVTGSECKNLLCRLAVITTVYPTIRPAEATGRHLNPLYLCTNPRSRQPSSETV